MQNKKRNGRNRTEREDGEIGKGSEGGGRREESRKLSIDLQLFRF